jgi:uncharacterized protein
MKIPILHLEEGDHHLEELIKKGSLHFYHDEVYQDEIRIKVVLNKFGKNISCRAEISTRIHLACDRCLAEFDRDLKEKFEMLFYIGQKEIGIDEENVAMIPPELKEIDLTPYIQETLILALPMKFLCREDCKGICAGCGADLNKESCRCSAESYDSRWEKLKGLKNKNK